ncbi:MAG: hypothetical protein ACYC7D_15915 [Nitrososphaerales archaeon]
MQRSDFSQPWTRKLLHEVRRSISPYAYLAETTASRTSVGLQIQDVIADQSGEGPYLKFIMLDHIADYELTSSNTAKFSGPGKREFVRRARERYNAIIQDSQKALLPSIYNRLVQVNEVNLSMTPLRKILMYVEEEGSITMDLLTRGLYPVSKSQKYLALLLDLEYIAEEGKAYVPGPAMKDLHAANIQPPVLYQRILGDVIQNRPKYLQEVLHWTMMVPYLRWSNAYYLPAYEVGHTLRLDKDDLIRNYERFYRRRHDTLTQRDQIGNIVSVGAIKKENGFYIGDDDVFLRFQKEADALASLEPIRVASA